MAECGERNPFAVLTEPDVLAIRQDQETPVPVLARYYEVSDSTIYRIKSGKTWAHVG